MHLVNGKAYLMKDKQLIILIGAARSGTKAFRDLFTTNPSASVIPYDINYIWNIGNEDHENDLFKPENVNPKNKGKISKFINKYYKNNNVLVEKTVSNTIRVPYVLSLFPNAKFVFLYREGLDVVESVERQWEKKVEKKYLLKKLKHVPIQQLLTYGLKYFKRNANKTKSDYFWGVKTPDLIKDLNTIPRIQAIANQWDFCVSRMLEDKNLIDKNNIVHVFYEDFVKQPKNAIDQIISKFNLDLDASKFDYSYIKSNNIGKASNALNKETVDKINHILSQTQNKVFKLKETLNQ